MYDQVVIVWGSIFISGPILQLGRPTAETIEVYIPERLRKLGDIGRERVKMVMVSIFRRIPDLEEESKSVRTESSCGEMTRPGVYSLRHQRMKEGRPCGEFGEIPISD